MLLSRERIQYILGGFWVLDAVLQLQPQMFTMNMVNSVMAPTVDNQPAFIAAGLKWIIGITEAHLVAVNWGIVLIQMLIGLCLLTNRFVKPALILSMLWAATVWYAGNGLGLLLTGQATALTGAPASIIFYALLGLVIYPRSENAQEGLLSRQLLRLTFAGFWLFAALLQLQPYWWQAGQISQSIAVGYSPGTLSGLLLDPSLHWFAGLTQNIEVPLNIVLIVIFLALAATIAFAKPAMYKNALLVAMIVSLLLWWITQAFGMILTGMATDPNSGILLIVVAFACWPEKYFLVKRTQHVLPRSYIEDASSRPILNLFGRTQLAAAEERIAQLEAQLNVALAKLDATQDQLRDAQVRIAGLEPQKMTSIPIGNANVSRTQAQTARKKRRSKK